MRALFVVAVAILALLSCATVAVGIEIRPSGRLSAVSSGALTFRANEGSFTCAVSLAGTIVERAEGSVGRREPATNPRAGSITSGSASECSAGSEMRLTFPERSWQGYIERYEGLRTLIYLLGAQILISAFILARCQYEGLIALNYDESTGAARITEITVLRQTSLGICPTEPTITGTINATAERAVFALGPRLTASPGTVSFGGSRLKSVTFINEWPVRLTISRLRWERAGSESLWTVLELTCGPIEPRGECRIEIEKKAESRNATIDLMAPRPEEERVVGEVGLAP
jgi:hypothetical protein